MKQAQLIAHIADATSASKSHVESILKTLGEVVQAELQQGGEVTLPGIGKLSGKHVEARVGRNPKTGDAVDIPAKIKPHFSAAKALKDAVNS